MTVASNSPTPVARAEPLNQHMTCATFDKLDVPVGAPLYTTPARAEAQDEGAAEEPVGQINALYASGMGEMRTVEWFGPMPSVGTHLYAHPSPTPAADADRVREAVTIIRDRLRQIWEGDTHLVYSGNPPEPSHDEEGDLAKLASEAVEALNSVFPIPDPLAALKSKGK